ncbi:unnamed protein product [Vitrella brassicaformis CCMP3155]|uniref:Poly(A) RNA polymerase mitochondrial-like central palm domain-containing protein n=1 Tax=Vitrella brassicaformis (strain CCMP3155) TaxID=1169540 RepID=A0A0G4FMG7_VITBC|nr:unnamed protein product [Vitrella brassicaformis CCMP3155]|eukprot:CEM15306.1 unnamed protein product [Vitrella brassicaformis CCMP3155]
MHLHCSDTALTMGAPFLVHGALRAHDRLLKPTRDQFRQKKDLVALFQPLLESRVGGTLHTFGSCENGFWIAGSDVDSCLVLKHCATKQACLSKLKLVRSLLQRAAVAERVDVIPAQVPIAKVYDRQDRNTCDVSINNTAALENSQLVGTLSRIDTRIRPLGRFIKYWATRRQINNRSQGTLSTYTLMLQLFYFLQIRDPPILPLYKLLEFPEAAARESEQKDMDETIKDLDTDESSDDDRPRDEEDAVAADDREFDHMSGELRPLPFHSDVRYISEHLFRENRRNRDSLGKLIHEFFMLWGDEQFAGGGMGRTVQIYDATNHLNDQGVLVMKCPLTKKNVNPFTIEVWQTIFQEFKRARRLLLTGASLSEVCEAAADNPISQRDRCRRQERLKAQILAKELGLLKGTAPPTLSFLTNMASPTPPTTPPTRQHTPDVTQSTLTDEPSAAPEPPAVELEEAALVMDSGHDGDTSSSSSSIREDALAAGFEEVPPWLTEAAEAMAISAKKAAKQKKKAARQLAANKAEAVQEIPLDPAEAAPTGEGSSEPAEVHPWITAESTWDEDEPTATSTKAAKKSKKKQGLRHGSRTVLPNLESDMADLADLRAQRREIDQRIRALQEAVRNPVENHTKLQRQRRGKGEGSGDSAAPPGPVAAGGAGGDKSGGKAKKRRKDAQSQTDVATEDDGSDDMWMSVGAKPRDDQPTTSPSPPSAPLPSVGDDGNEVVVVAARLRGAGEGMSTGVQHSDACVG